MLFLTLFCLARFLLANGCANECLGVHTTKHKVELSVIWLAQPKKNPHWKFRQKWNILRPDPDYLPWGSAPWNRCRWYGYAGWPSHRPLSPSFPLLSPTPQCFYTSDSAQNLPVPHCKVTFSGLKMILKFTWPIECWNKPNSIQILTSFGVS